MIYKYVFIGARNLAAEFKKNGCDVKYISASNFMALPNNDIFSDAIIVLAHSNALSEAKYRIKTVHSMSRIIDKFIEFSAVHKIVLSSAAVYGLRTSHGALSEQARLLGFSQYALEKRNMEYRLRGAQILKENITILRVSSILYSEMTMSGNLFTNLTQLKQGTLEYLSVEHKGMQMRDFCTIDTLISVFHMCYRRAGPLVYNLADVEAIKIKSLVSLFFDGSNHSNVRYQAGDTTKIHCHLDISLAAKRFGIVKYPIRDILANLRKH